MPCGYEVLGFTVFCTVKPSIKCLQSSLRFSKDQCCFSISDNSNGVPSAMMPSSARSMAAECTELCLARSTCFDPEAGNAVITCWVHIQETYKYTYTYIYIYMHAHMHAATVHAEPPLQRPCRATDTLHAMSANQSAATLQSHRHVVEILLRGYIYT